MPRKCEAGTFEGAPHFRWTKMHKGVRYRVTCEELQAQVRTKEGSMQLANAWWRKKLTELEGPSPLQTAFDTTIGRLTPEQLRRMAEAGRAAEAVLTAGGDMNKAIGNGLVEILVANPPTQEDLERIFATPLTDERRLEVVGQLGERLGQSSPGELTIGHQLKRYLDRKKEMADTGVIKVGTYGAIFERLHGIFLPWAGVSTPLTAITRDWWEKWFVFCAGKVAAADDGKKGWSSEYAAGIFGNCKSFIRWLWENELIDSLPRDFDRKGAHKFERPEPIKRRFTTSEVTTLLAQAPGQLRLHLLLMLNCGMTQKDISELRQSQIVLKDGKGYIVRRRTKTERKKKTPKVRYLLWDVTLQELLKWRSQDETYALLNTKFKAKWVRETIREDGRKSKADGIKSNFNHLQRKTGIKKSLKMFRKTSATRLNKSRNYERLLYLFLGHRAPDIARNNYAAPRKLEQAIIWLGKTYGLA